jgi:hypothetical protein
VNSNSCVHPFSSLTTQDADDDNAFIKLNKDAVLPHPHTNDRFMDPAELLLKVKTLEADKRGLTAKLSALQRRFSELSAEIDENAVSDDKQKQFLLHLGDHVFGASARKRRWKAMFKGHGELAEFWENQREKWTQQKQGYRWSPLALRLSMSVFLRSPSAYEALRNANIILLPNRRTLQSYIRSNAMGSGFQREIFDQMEQAYTDHVKTLEATTPFNDAMKAVLAKKYTWMIFDEMNVKNGLAMNSKSGALYGISASSNFDQDIEDILAELNQTDDDVDNSAGGMASSASNGALQMAQKIAGKQTSKVLQVMFRSESTCWDFLGPFFFTTSGMDSNDITSMILDTTLEMSKNGFRLTLVICDGVAVNFSAMKHLFAALHPKDQIVNPSRSSQLPSVESQPKENEIPDANVDSLVSASSHSASDQKSKCDRAAPSSTLSASHVTNEKKSRAKYILHPVTGTLRHLVINN